MKSISVAVVLVVSLSFPAFAHNHKSVRRTLDPSYSSALAAANHFLQAWQAEDHETGIVMLTDSARQHATPDELQHFFSPGPNAAYEIAHGKRMSTAAYKFPVVLFSASNTSLRPRCSVIVITRNGKSDWFVERLP